MLIQQGDTSLWSGYGTEFVERFALDTAQAQKVRQFLADCKYMAQAYINRNSAELLRVDEELQKPDLNDVQIKALRADQVRLRKTRDEISERQLKPRLEVFPTRSQRAAAVTAEPSTKPAVATMDKMPEKSRPSNCFRRCSPRERASTRLCRGSIERIVARLAAS